MEHNLTKPSGAIEQVSADTGLTAKQEKCAVMMASGLRISEVAKALDVSRGAVYRWLDLLPFQCFYNMIRQDVKNFMEGSLLELHSQALDGIKASLASDNESIRMKASMWVAERICQMKVGCADVRQAIREECEAGNWFDEQAYKRALGKAGLD